MTTIASERDASQTRQIAMLLLAASLFGVMAVCVRAASLQMPATQITFVRFAGALLFMIVATRGRGLLPRSGKIGGLLLRGVIGGVAITFYFVAIERAGAGVATLVQNSFPVFAALLAALLGDEVFSWRIGAALGLSLCGAIVVLGARLDFASASTIGVLAALASSMLGGGAVVTAQRMRRWESAAVITTWFMAVGAVMTSPALLTGAPSLDATLVALLAGVIVTSVLAQWLLHHGLGFTSASRGSLAAATSVFVAATLEAVALGDVPDAQTLAGAALMLSAVALAWHGVSASAKQTLAAR